MSNLPKRVAALTLAVLALVPSTLAQGGDACSTPSVLSSTGTYNFDTTAATTSGFQGQSSCPGGVSDANQDLFWTFTVPENGHYLFSTMGSSFDTVMKVYDGGGCAAICLDANDNWFLLQSEVRLYSLSAGQSILVQVGGYTSPFAGQAPEFGAGTLTIEKVLDPCTGVVVADFLEDSDRCDSASDIGDGTYANLSVSDIDGDFYALEVAPGATLDLIVDVFTTADMLMVLWDAEARCVVSDLNQAIALGSVGPFNPGISQMSVTYTNQASSPQDLILEIRMISMDSCGPYGLTVSGSSGAPLAPPIGTTYCATVANSSGEPGTLWAVGSRFVVDNRVTLMAASLPRQAFGFFLVSQAAGFTANPAGSAGNLCLGGNVGRYVGPGQIQLSGQSGRMELGIDLTAVPQPNGPYLVVAGDRLYFQAWVRDAVGGIPTSNFTNGVEVSFI